jgi:PAS domain S-box-containing protein
MKNWFHLLFKKRLSASLFFILPIVLALTAFSSGFIALIFLDNFVTSSSQSISPSDMYTLSIVINYIRKEILMFTLLGGAAGFGIAYAIHRSMKQFMSGAQLLTQGDFSARLNIEGLDELGILGKDFNRMASSLNKYFIDSMTAGWILLDKDGKVVSINPGAQTILGCQTDDLVGSPVENLAWFVSKDKLFTTTIRDSIEHQKPTAREINLTTSDGRSIRVSLSTTVMKNSDSAFVGVAVTLKDLTRAGEITEHMQRADKLSALGTMAASLAHEIRNPLGAIKGLTQLLHEKFPEGDPSKTYTQTMIKEVDRLNGVISNLLKFSQPSASEFLFCDINNLLEQAAELVRLNSENKKGRMEKKYSPSLPPIWADGGKLVQAFLNVMLNAEQALKTGGSGSDSRTLIESRFDPSASISLAPDAEKGCIIVEISNAGPPIDPALGDRIFDPFVTSKKEGTGLGLAITHQIVSMHQGTISFSHRDGFTVFTFRFPLTKTENPVSANKDAK